MSAFQENDQIIDVIVPYKRPIVKGLHNSKFELQNKERRLAAEVKTNRDISVVFTKKKVWTSAPVLGIVVARAEKKPLPQRKKS